MSNSSDNFFYVDDFKESDAQRPQIFMPVNLLKQKVGNGGIDQSRIEHAQQLIDNCSTDVFLPLIDELLSIIDTLIKLCRHKEYDNSEKFIEDFAAAFIQIKAHGGMFKYPLMSSVAQNAVRFLDHIPCTDTKSLDVIEAHYHAVKVISDKKLEGDGGQIGAALKDELNNACMRYFKAQTTIQ